VAGFCECGSELSGSKNEGNFLTDLGPVSFSGRALLRVVRSGQRLRRIQVTVRRIQVLVTLPTKSRRDGRSNWKSVLWDVKLRRWVSNVSASRGMEGVGGARRCTSYKDAALRRVLSGSCSSWK
jgi:hypothetical protein